MTTYQKNRLSDTIKRKDEICHIGTKAKWIGKLHKPKCPNCGILFDTHPKFKNHLIDVNNEIEITRPKIRIK
ncbi:hypothetical protein LCGC14_0617590 [marine sediment metagenome]|uniref:Uncharacterized protein n=1 Tax=marine sediment metagenome TaxID=412755 RepID=A0A0F9RQ21_9ZZZZ